MKNNYTTEESYTTPVVLIAVASERSKGSIDELETFINFDCFFSAFTYSKENSLWSLKEKQTTRHVNKNSERRQKLSGLFIIAEHRKF